jgi:acetyl esterase/lipase
MENMKYTQKDYPLPAAQEVSKKEKKKRVSVKKEKARLHGEMLTIRRSFGGVSRDVTRRPIVMEDKIIQSHDGESIRVRLYRPKAQRRRGAMPLQLYIHGGAWFAGTIQAVEEYCKALCDRADIIVASPEYRLSPEHKFPCGLMDCRAALLWLWENADYIGADRSSFSVSGDSAGGNYSAVLTQMVRETEVKLSSQILLYPVTRSLCSDYDEKSAKSNPMGIFGEVIGEWYMDNPKEQSRDPRVSPAFYEDLSGLPRAMVVVCDLDPLHVEGEEYAKMLSAAGVDTSLFMYRNTKHAFMDNVGTLKQAEDLVDDVVVFLSEDNN